MCPGFCVHIKVRHFWGAYHTTVLYILISNTEITPRQIPIICMQENLSLNKSFETITLNSIVKIDIKGNSIVAFIFDDK